MPPPDLSGWDCRLVASVHLSCDCRDVWSLSSRHQDLFCDVHHHWLIFIVAGDRVAGPIDVIADTVAPRSGREGAPSADVALIGVTRRTGCGEDPSWAIAEFGSPTVAAVPVDLCSGWPLAGLACA